MEFSWWTILSWWLLYRSLREAKDGKRRLGKATNWFSVETAQILHGHTAHFFSIDVAQDHGLFRKNTINLFSTAISQEGKRTLLEHTADTSWANSVLDFSGCSRWEQFDYEVKLGQDMYWKLWKKLWRDSYQWYSTGRQ